MTSHRMFAVSVVILMELFGFVRMQGKPESTRALKFDVLRNPSALTLENATCVRMNCSVTLAAHDLLRIQRVYSLIISEETQDGREKHLANITSSDTAVNFEDPESTSGTGHVSTIRGSLEVELKSTIDNCSSLTYSCKLQFKNTMGVGEVVKVVKWPSVTSVPEKQSPPSSQDPDTIKDLKNFIAHQIYLAGKKSQATARHFLEDVQKVDQRLLRLEDKMDMLLNTRIRSIDKDLRDLHEILTKENNKIDSLDEKLDNATDLIGSDINDKFDELQRQTNNVEEALVYLNSSADTMVRLSQRSSATFERACDDLGTNLSSAIYQGHDTLSMFKNEVMQKLSALEGKMEHSGVKENIRLMDEAMVMLAQNISGLRGGLTALSAEMDKELKNIQTDLAYAKETMGLKHSRLTRDVNTRLHQFDIKFTGNLSKLEGEWESLKSKDRELISKLINLEINLNDIRIIARSLNSIFRF